uniref:Uncharacterized protein n=1 Tax=Fagus sylvatica TaxID=28930 RepID=A0A2N9I6V4_FAGSY
MVMSMSIALLVMTCLKDGGVVTKEGFQFSEHSGFIVIPPCKQALICLVLLSSGSQRSTSKIEEVELG